MQGKAFSLEWFRRKTRFDAEPNHNLEMGYCGFGGSEDLPSRSCLQQGSFFVNLFIIILYVATRGSQR